MTEYTCVNHNLICNRIYKASPLDGSAALDVINDEQQTLRVQTFKDLRWFPTLDRQTIEEVENIKVAPIEGTDPKSYVLNTDKTNSTITINGKIEGPSIEDLYNKIAIVVASAS